MKFKNIRRPTRSKKAGIALTGPPKKKARMQNDDIEDEPGYDRHVEYLQQLYSSKRASIHSILTVLEQTAQRRRTWIFSESPPTVKEIMEKFPCFNDPRIVSNIIITVQDAVAIMLFGHLLINLIIALIPCFV